MRVYKMKALFKLGIEDLTKNISVFVYVLFPLLFALLYGNLDTGMPENYVYSFCVLMNLAMIPVTLMGTVIAEEKEKNTLRTLMLNDVRAGEIMLAKALICMLFVVTDNVIMYFILGLSLDKFVLYQLVGLYAGLSVIFFGAFVGIFARNQMSAGLMSMPFMFLFMAPFFIEMFHNKIADRISSLLPTDAMMTLFESISGNKLGWSAVGMPVIVIGVWLVISIVMYKLAFKKVGMDN